MTAPFLLKADRSSHMCAYCIFLTYSSVVEHLDWFASFAIVNSAALNTDVRASLGCTDLDDFG